MTTISSVTTRPPAVSSPLAVEEAPVADPPSDAGDGSPTAPVPETAALGWGGASLSALAVFLARADEQDRDSAGKLMTTEDQAAAREAHAQVQDLDAKAGDDELAGIFEGAGEAVGGVCTAMSACVGKGIAHDIFDSLSKALPGAGKLSAAIASTDGAHDDAQATGDKAASEMDVRAYDRAQADQQAAQAALQRVADVVGQMQEAENATLLTAATIRA